MNAAAVGYGFRAGTEEGVPGRADPMPLPGALAEWLGSGLQSRLQRFDSARRLYSNGTKPGAPGQVPDTLHLLLPVEPPQIDLSRLRLPMPQEPLCQRLEA